MKNLFTNYSSNTYGRFSEGHAIPPSYICFFPRIKTDLEHYMFALHCLLLCKISNTELHFKLCHQLLTWLPPSVTKVSDSLGIATVITQTHSLQEEQKHSRVRPQGNPLSFRNHHSPQDGLSSPSSAAEAYWWHHFCPHEITTPSLALCPIHFLPIYCLSCLLAFATQLFSLCPLGPAHTSK